MKCITKGCNNKEKNKKRNLCAACISKEWRKNNPDKIKAYYERKEDHINKWRKYYYAKNMEKLKNNQKEIGKTEKFKRDRRKKAKTFIELVRGRTRAKYPLKGNSCVKCPLDAKHRHHTTTPPEVDKFLFLCHKHHMKIHGKNSYDKNDALQKQDGESK